MCLGNVSSMGAVFVQSDHQGRRYGPADGNHNRTYLLLLDVQIPSGQHLLIQRNHKTLTLKVENRDYNFEYAGN